MSGNITQRAPVIESAASTAYSQQGVNKQNAIARPSRLTDSPARQRSNGENEIQDQGRRAWSSFSMRGSLMRVFDTRLLGRLSSSSISFLVNLNPGVDNGNSLPRETSRTAAKATPRDVGVFVFDGLLMMALSGLATTFYLWLYTYVMFRYDYPATPQHVQALCNVTSDNVGVPYKDYEEFMCLALEAGNAGIMVYNLVRTYLVLHALVYSFAETFPSRWNIPRVRKQVLIMSNVISVISLSLYYVGIIFRNGILRINAYLFFCILWTMIIYFCTEDRNATEGVLEHQEASGKREEIRTKEGSDRQKHKISPAPGMESNCRKNHQSADGCGKNGISDDEEKAQNAKCGKHRHRKKRNCKNLALLLVAGLLPPISFWVFLRDVYNLEYNLIVNGDIATLELINRWVLPLIFFFLSLITKRSLFANLHHGTVTVYLSSSAGGAASVREPEPDTTISPYAISFIIFMTSQVFHSVSRILLPRDPGVIAQQITFSVVMSCCTCFLTLTWNIVLVHRYKERRIGAVSREVSGSTPTPAPARHIEHETPTSGVGTDGRNNGIASLVVGGADPVQNRPTNASSSTFGVVPRNSPPLLPDGATERERSDDKSVTPSRSDMANSRSSIGQFSSGSFAPATPGALPCTSEGPVPLPNARNSTLFQGKSRASVSSVGTSGSAIEEGHVTKRASMAILPMTRRAFVEAGREVLASHGLLLWKQLSISLITAIFSSSGMLYSLMYFRKVYSTSVFLNEPCFPPPSLLSNQTYRSFYASNSESFTSQVSPQFTLAVAELSFAERVKLKKFLQDAFFFDGDMAKVRESIWLLIAYAFLVLVLVTAFAMVLQGMNLRLFQSWSETRYTLMRILLGVGLCYGPYVMPSLLKVILQIPQC